jgi:hypothetical protein
MRSELYDHLTLAQMDVHTGFGINGYDLVRLAGTGTCGLNKG